MTLRLAAGRRRIAWLATIGLLAFSAGCMEGTWPSTSGSSTPGPLPTGAPLPTPTPQATPAPTETDGCTDNTECDNNLYCDGQELCVDGECQNGTPPCNGLTETCDEGENTCVPIEEPCTSDNDCEGEEHCDVETGECVAVEPSVCSAGAGNCYVANYTPGCESQLCCDLICAYDWSCCGLYWDEDCAAQAIRLCPTE